MQWTNYKPKIGDQRYKVKFAFFPKRVGKGTIIWLERYISIQTFQPVTHFYGDGIACLEYIQNEWVEIRTSIWAGNDHSIITNR